MPETGKKQEKFQGKYTGAVGRRKTAIARVRVHANGGGFISVNGFEANKYFKEEDLLLTATQPLKLAGLSKDFDISIHISGGGKKNQSEAARHGICRALMLINPELKLSFKAKGWTTRDARKKERKKPGLKKARRAPQWAKR